MTMIFPLLGVQSRSISTRSYLKRNDLPTVTESLQSNSRNNRVYSTLREQSREQKLRNFLGELRQRGEISDDVADSAWNSWRLLASLMSHNLLVPDAASAPDGQVIFSWNKGDYHFELELLPRGLGEFFFLNYRTNDVWGEDYHVGDTISDDVRHFLTLFAIYE